MKDCIRVYLGRRHCRGLVTSRAKRMLEDTGEIGLNKLDYVPPGAKAAYELMSAPKGT